MEYSEVPLQSGLHPKSITPGGTGIEEPRGVESCQHREILASPHLDTLRVRIESDFSTEDMDCTFNDKSTRSGTL